MLDMVLPMMRGIATGCQIKDKAFWPTSLAQADALPVPSEAAQGVMHPKEEDDGPLDMLGVLPRSLRSHMHMYRQWRQISSAIQALLYPSSQGHMSGHMAAGQALAALVKQTAIWK